MKTVVAAILAAERKVVLPNPDVAAWPEFVKGVNKLVDVAPETLCSVRRAAAPWVDMAALTAFVPDPITLIVDTNEELLWRIFVYYALNSAHVDRAPHNRHGAAAHNVPHAHAHPHSPHQQLFTSSVSARPPLRPAPTFRAALSKYHKRLLKQDHLWLLLNDFGLVPAVINTVRFAKLMKDIVQPRTAARAAAGPKAKITFRQYLRVLLSIADSGFPTLEPANRVVRLLAVMELTGHLHRIGEGSASFAFEGIAAAAERDLLVRDVMGGAGYMGALHGSPTKGVPGAGAGHGLALPPPPRGDGGVAEVKDSSFTVSSPPHWRSPAPHGMAGATPRRSPGAAGSPMPPAPSMIKFPPPLAPALAAETPVAFGSSSGSNGSPPFVSTTPAQAAPHGHVTFSSVHRGVSPASAIATPHSAAAGYALAFRDTAASSFSSSTLRGPPPSFASARSRSRSPGPPQGSSTALALVPSQPPVAVPALVQLLDERDYLRSENDQAMLALQVQYSGRGRHAFFVWYHIVSRHPPSPTHAPTYQRMPSPQDSFYRIQNLEGLLDETKGAVSPLRKKVQETKATLSAVERMNDSFQEQIRNEQAEIERLRHQLADKDEATRHNSALLADLSCQQDDLNDEKDRVAVWRIERDRLLEVVDESERRIDELEARHRADKEDAHALRATIDHLSATNAALTARIGDMQASAIPLLPRPYTDGPI